VGLLIGRHGQTIDSLQAVANAVMWRSGAGKPVTIDTAGYRDRRRAALEAIAFEAAERAASGERVVLDPMTSVERKVVHGCLEQRPGVRTSSIGTEPARCVVVERLAGDDADA